MGYFSSIINKIVEIAEADVLVNTVSMGSVEDIDLEKKNIYPLVHIDVEGGSFTNGQTVVLSLVIECVSIRDINKHELDTDKVYGNDNQVDNLDTCLTILNRIWKNFYRDFAGENLTANENPNFTAITYDHTNLLDGWSLTIDIEVPDTDIALC